ncbi:tRNA pseudouridine(55) synthase TruB [Truepera radiovictrix]|uniref:tRNA pseudouridine synthase B n=1 Tax=Truepera radiovictrix (strain DSM 17093 / CIP 108686 / LMG 22925 / RQ-24) TaxID=649638 RepID=D7CTQ9_TRURR|nr:tRNA pseudouridine(55) synthase TruB [Truepera radiovictrix]ADI15606.1 tRNA pseudouridine synthase B [Truepera radiovictrix DSM 17093]WMT58765.1 tRNA pseudouridine(55) synthase TruB [Truepera radiovictrix]
MPVYIVDKPLGLTSHDVVAHARKALRTRQVGHAGTLDPLATGVLVLLTHEATKLSPFLSGSDKAYLAWVAFGASTPTLDTEGPISETGDASQLTAERVAAALPPFLALTEQRPPQYSAVKRGGVKGYEAARRGEALELGARPAGYRRLELLGFAPTRDALPSPVPATLPEPLGALPTALLKLEVRAGTYVRAFARDLGAALGVPAHLAGLVRTRAGRFSLADALPLTALGEAAGRPLADALPYPLLTLSQQEALRVRQGQPPALREALDVGARVGLVDPEGQLVAVAERQEGRLKLLRVWV